MRFNKTTKPTSYKLTAISCVFLILALFLPQVVLAADVFSVVGNAITTLLNLILQPVSVLLGSLLTLIIELLIFVAQYNNFTNEPAVATAWVLLRDIGNMFFVVIIVLVGFAEMFNLEKLKAVRVGTFLPKLALGVILINFSKGIVGILIDLSQIITLTFVAAFRDVAASNLIVGLGLSDLFSGSVFSGGNFGGQMNLFLNLMMINIILAIAIIIIAMIVALFVTRIVAFWILTVVSPVMMAASVFPFGGLQVHYAKWWEKFAAYLTLGPTLAFMVWLSFLILQNGTDISSVRKELSVSGEYTARAQNNQGDISQIGRAATDASKSSIPGLDFTTILGFVMGAGVLVGTVFVAQQAKVAGAKQISGQAMGALKNTGVYAAKGAGRLSAAGRGMVMGGAGVALQRVGGTAVYKKDEKGNDMLDEKGNKILEKYVPKNILGRLGGFSTRAGKEGFTKIGKDNYRQAKERLNQFFGRGQDKIDADDKEMAAGKFGIIKAALKGAKGGALRADEEKRKKQKEQKKDYEKFNQEQYSAGQGIGSMSEGASLLSSAKDDGERNNILAGMLNNKNLTAEEKEEAWKKKELIAKKINSKQLMQDSKIDKVKVFGDINNPKAKKETDELLKEAAQSIKPEVLYKMATQLMLELKDDPYNERLRSQVDTMIALTEQMQADKKLNEGQASDIAKSLINKGKDYLETDHGEGTKKHLMSLLKPEERQKVFSRNFGDGKDDKREEQWQDYLMKNPELAQQQKLADEMKENKRQQDMEKSVATVFSGADREAKIDIVKNGLESSDSLRSATVVNQVNDISIITEAMDDLNWGKAKNNLDVNNVITKIIMDNNLTGQQFNKIVEKLSTKVDMTAPKEIKNLADVLQLSMVEVNHLDKMSHEELDDYMEKVKEAMAQRDALMTKMTDRQKQELGQYLDGAFRDLSFKEKEATTRRYSKFL